MDGKCKHPSLWQEEPQPEPCQALTGHQTADVLVVGGGMAGILCARYLQGAGISCIVAEGGRVGSGVTAKTTAKVTSQHGLIYSDLIKRRGIGAAALYYQANQASVEEYRRLSQEISCDFEEKVAHIYSTNGRKELEAEEEAYRRLNIPGTLRQEAQIPISVAGALAMEGQGQFHPLKFLYGAAKGLTIYENTPVQAIRNGAVKTPNGSINAKAVVLATHFPMINIPGLYFMKLYQSRSYVIALKGAPQPDGLYLDREDQGFSFRTHGEHLLLGGGDHKTGEPGGGWTSLRALAASAYPNAVETHAWATQDCMSLDAAPYLGRLRAAGTALYVATGFHKWGMTGSMTAARVLTELITTGRSDYEEVFSPKRSMLTAQLWINLGSAAINLVRPARRCSHMGCALRQNEAEGSWDCPCHGSRFDRQGRVLDNPAKRGLRG